MAKSTVTDCSSMGQRYITQVSNSSVKPNAATGAFHLKPSWRGNLLKTHRRTKWEPQGGIFLCFYNIWVILTYEKQISALLLEICVGWWRCEGRSGRNARLDLDSTGRYWSVSLPLIFSTLGDPKIFILSKNRTLGNVPVAAVIVINWVKLSGSFSSTHSHSYSWKKGQRCSAVLHWAPGGSVAQASFEPVVMYYR